MQDGNTLSTRTIISYYFDTANMQMFCDSEEGTLPRKKVRYRRYGQSKKLQKKKISSIGGALKQLKFVYL